MAFHRTVPQSGIPQLSPLSWEKGSVFHPFDSTPGIPSNYLLSQERVSQSLAVGGPGAQSSRSEAVGFSRQFSPSYSPISLRVQAQTPDSTYIEGLSGTAGEVWNFSMTHILPNYIVVCFPKY